MEHGGALLLPPGVAQLCAEVFWVSIEVPVVREAPGVSEAITWVLLALPVVFGGNGGPTSCLETWLKVRLKSLKVELSRDISMRNVRKFT